MSRSGIGAGLRFAAALGFAGLAWSAGPAHAQFVCLSTDGTGGGADASGSPTNFACGGANASGNNSANHASGSNANASGNGSFNNASGSQANASGNGSFNNASGFNANASGDNSANIAIGRNANASGDDRNSIAIGTNANAAGVNSVAIGADAVAGRDNQFALGTKANTYTMAGIGSAASKAAQSGPIEVVTSDADGNLATSSLAGLGFASQGDISAINSRLDDLNNNTNRALQGIAMAFALAGTPVVLPHETFAITGNWGTFEGQNALAFGAALKIDSHTQVNAGIAYGMNEGTVGARAGVRIGW